MRTILSRYIDPAVLALVADRHFEPRDLIVGNMAGAHKSPLSGFAVEFAGHREYVPGDDPKHIDWRVFFNRDKYFVKQYELETNFVCNFVLDTSASMRYGEANEQKLAYASRLAMTLAFSVVRQSDKASLALFDDRVCHFVPPGNSLEQILRMGDQLDRSRDTAKTRLGECLMEVASRLGRREIVMIFSDFFGDTDELEQGVQRLRYDRHEVLLFHVLHEDELRFPFEGMLRAVGLEDEGNLPIAAVDVRSDYLRLMQAFRNKVQAIASQNHCEYILASTANPLADLLSDYLNERSQRNANH
ncbi:MAG: DUF58 domain-containing protein [Planctomycetaceae bacterium]|nr:DUF58 domain-containing protein [Planctomycetales bacterium]MCB9872652.1 DUF58 domain-containing protein [Planctomycetaceae bacterium]MCB9939522.1 DUF58 domain-containing protein [Planctomycetaceae bacterium]